MSKTGVVTYVDMTCGNCGITWGMPEALYENQLKLREHGGWWCPNGHLRHFVGKSDEQKLRDELARERHRLDQARAEAERQQRMREGAERRLSATRGVVTRIKNRVGKGVCPCCNRTFQNLGKHMAHRHPTWAPDEVGQE